MKTKHEIIKKLDTIDFHDIPVSKISLDSGKSSGLMIEFALYNEQAKDYELMLLRFDRIIEIRTEGFIFNSQSDIEIYKFNYQWNEKFRGEIFFNLGFGQSTFLISIECQDIELFSL